MNFLGYVLGTIIWTGFSMVVAFGLALKFGGDSPTVWGWGSFAACMFLGMFFFVCSFVPYMEPVKKV